jgi:hypothetical protein
MRVSLVSLLLLAPVAVAQEVASPAPPERPVVYEKETFLDFEDGLLIDGKVEVPEGAVVFEQLAPAARSFVPLRLAFDRELRASVDEVR